MRPMIVLALLILLILFGGRFARPAHAQAMRVIVNSTSDISDRNIGDGLCDISVNQGEQCSLRAAIEELNAQGPQAMPHQIHFDIPGTGPFVIMPESGFPIIEVPVIIDGTTQPGTTCPTATSPARLMIVIDGRFAVPPPNTVEPSGLEFGTINAEVDGNVLKGVVVGNFGLEDRLGRGALFYGDNNLITCSHFGVHSDGSTPMPNGAGVGTEGDNNRIGGINYADRNVASDNKDYGIGIAGEGNRVQGNFVGTTSDGLNALGNDYFGIVDIYGTNSIIGGADPKARNIVSGNRRDGIGMAITSGTQIINNYIGVTRDGTAPLPNGKTGIRIYGDSTQNRIGGTDPALGNVIAHNGSHGIVLETDIYGTPKQNTILANSIYGNSGLGIALGDNDIDTNDTGDGDVGENEHQNYPVLQSAVGQRVAGQLQSQPNTQYWLSFFGSERCDTSGNGEGQNPLGGFTVETNAQGRAMFDQQLAGLLPNTFFTATATDPDGNTSEFSACIRAEETITPTATTVAPETPTPAITATSSITPGPTSTSTGVISDTVTPPPAGTATPSATPNATPTPTATPAATGSITPVPTASVTGTLPTTVPIADTPVPPGLGTATPTATPTAPGIVMDTVTPVPSGTATPNIEGRGRSTLIYIPVAAR